MPFAVLVFGAEVPIALRQHLIIVFPQNRCLGWLPRFVHVGGDWLTALRLCALAEGLHQNLLVQRICRDFVRIRKSGPSTFGERHKC